MNFSWAMDLDPKGANNQIKEAIDKRYLPDDEEPITQEEQISEYCLQLLKPESQWNTTSELRWTRCFFNFMFLTMVYSLYQMEF